MASYSCCSLRTLYTYFGMHIDHRGNVVQYLVPTPFATKFLRGINLSSRKRLSRPQPQPR